jgi:NADH-quinone oxidoreductase subunit J
MLLNNLFYLFSIFLVFSAFMVIVSKHPVFSLLFLVSSFIFSAFLLFLLECEFLALLFIVVYVGAIAVLFLFAVMMLESKLSDLSKNVTGYLPVGAIIGGVTFFLFKSTFNENFEKSNNHGFYDNSYTNWYDLIDSTNDVEVYGQVLYSFFVLQFLIAGLILLLILIGVVYLTNTNSSDEKPLDQVVFKQLARNSKLKKVSFK